MREVEAAKRELVEYQQLTEQKLQEEREKTNRAVVSLIVLLTPFTRLLYGLTNGLSDVFVCSPACFRFSFSSFISIYFICRMSDVDGTPYSSAFERALNNDYVI